MRSTVLLRRRSERSLLLEDDHDGVKLVPHEAAPTVTVTATVYPTVAPEMSNSMVAFPPESVVP